MSEIGMTYSNINHMDHIKDVILMLSEYVRVGEVEKKKFGEVMTPLELVKEMLQTLPEEVWSDPTLKWLDPANGTGPFPAMVIYKLMEGLKEWEPDDSKRYKHIIENMIYVAELQPKNMFLWLCAVDPFDEYKCNIYTGSFLEDGFDKHMKDVWGVEKFDIVIGNPPYQWKRENETKSHPLWHLFVEKSIENLRKNGYLVMVHPSGWRNVDGKFRNIYDLLLTKNIIYLNVNDFDKGKETFGVGTNYDYYCIQNIEYNKKTTFVDIDDNEEVVDLMKLSFIPNGKFNKFIKLFTNDKDQRVEILHSYSDYETRKSYVSEIRTADFIHQCVYTITKRLGVKCFYSNVTNKGHFDIPKIIWSNGLGTYPIIDINGEYGLTQFSYGLVDKSENLENIKNAMSSEEFVELMKYVRFQNHKYDRKVISTFKKDFWKEFI